MRHDADSLGRQISYTVEGRVQGVFFRDFTSKQARSLAITGYVENVPSGNVEGEAQGSDNAIKEFLEHIKKGPSAAQVTKVDHQEIASKSGETGFGKR